MQLGIEPAALEKFLVVSLFDDIAVSHDEDQIGIPDGGQTVSDYKAGAIFHEVVHGSLDQYFGTGIH